MQANCKLAAVHAQYKHAVFIESQITLSMGAGAAGVRPSSGEAAGV